MIIAKVPALVMCHWINYVVIFLTENSYYLMLSYSFLKFETFGLRWE